MAVRHNAGTVLCACGCRWLREPEPCAKRNEQTNREGFQGGLLVEKRDVRILVVDDEESTTDSLKLNLVEEGYTVDTAGTGGQAIELFDQGGHHLAICDLQLPDMDGLEVMRHMKDARPN